MAGYIIYMKRHNYNAAMAFVIFVSLISMYYNYKQTPHWKKLVKAFKTLTDKSGTGAGDSTKNEEALDELQEAISIATTKYNILMWGVPYGDWYPRNNIVPSRCGNCEITYDKEKVNDSLTKAVIFHFDHADLKNMPQNRRSDQYYVWFNLESPSTLKILRGFKLTEYDNFFNLTMTYRRDSDIYFPYNTSSKILEDLQSKGSGDLNKDLDEVLNKKSKLALWVVRNCGSTAGARERMDFSDKLVKTSFSLDRIGDCFRKQPNPLADTDNKTLFHDYVSQYKFYMSFENSIHCSDYITEKFFNNALYHGVVPVVMGAKKSDYEKIAPKNSFIHVDDFKNEIYLRNFLEFLDDNDIAYREYLTWRLGDVRETPDYGRAIEMCQLCRVLHGINTDNVYHPWYNEKRLEIPKFGYPEKPRVVASLSDWFYGQNDKKCFKNYRKKGLLSKLSTLINRFFIPQPYV